MKHLKLVVNNENKKRDIFFNKKELKLIFNLYAQMVSGGEWKDYILHVAYQTQFISDFTTSFDAKCI